jgi:Ran GTPase-activating protein (RanGAP) involved in mRNA processing and transport
MSRLESLNCDGNKFGDRVCETLCDMICKLKSLTIVNFSRCTIGDPGAYQLAKVLISRYLNLRCLMLHWNNIKERGSIALAKALKYNRTLQIFDASFNCFGHSILKRKRIKEEEELKEEDGEEEIEVEVKPIEDDGKPVDIPPEILEDYYKYPEYNDEEF